MDFGFMISDFGFVQAKSKSLYYYFVYKISYQFKLMIIKKFR